MGITLDPGENTTEIHLEKKPETYRVRGTLHVPPGSRPASGTAEIEQTKVDLKEGNFELQMSKKGRKSLLIEYREGRNIYIHEVKLPRVKEERINLGTIQLPGKLLLEGELKGPDGFPAVTERDGLSKPYIHK